MDNDESQEKFDLPGTPAADSPNSKRKSRRILFYLAMAALVVVIGVFVFVTALPGGANG